MQQGSNLLMDEHGNLKLGDFGLAIQPNPKLLVPLTNRVITLWYRPPEVLMGSTDYDASVDIWSSGCIFAELLVPRTLQYWSLPCT
jgi:serine/threonine protein kinase